MSEQYMSTYNSSPDKSTPESSPVQMEIVQTIQFSMTISSDSGFF